MQQKIGILGAGRVGSAIARVAIAAGEGAPAAPGLVVTLRRGA